MSTFDDSTWYTSPQDATGTFVTAPTSGFDLPDDLTWATAPQYTIPEGPGLDNSFIPGTITIGGGGGGFNGGVAISPWQPPPTAIVPWQPPPTGGASVNTDYFTANSSTNNTGMTCKPTDCYTACRERDLELQKRCKALNDAWVLKMKEIGCVGTKCSMKSIAKTCSKRKTTKKSCGCSTR